MNFDYKRLTDLNVNVGEKDKKIRLIAGSVILAVSLFTAKILLLLIGLVLIATGYTRVCPAYSAMGKSTLDSDGASPEADSKTK